MSKDVLSKHIRVLVAHQMLEANLVVDNQNHCLVLVEAVVFESCESSKLAGLIRFNC